MACDFDTQETRLYDIVHAAREEKRCDSTWVVVRASADSCVVLLLDRGSLEPAHQWPVGYPMVCRVGGFSARHITRRE